MKIFVTGATGLIGSHFLKQSIEEGNEVIGLKRSSSSQPRINLKQEPAWVSKGLNELQEDDFRDVDVVVHLAAHSMFPPYDTLENCFYWNVITPVEVFKKAIKAGVKKFVVAGSCSEYGQSGEELEFIPTFAPLLPTHTYSASKAASFIAFFQLAIEFEVSLSYHRIFHVYGEGEAKERLWPSLKEAAKSGKNFAMTKGEQIRDFIPVEHVAGHMLQFCHKGPFSVPFIENLGTGMPMSILEFSKKWWSFWEAKGELLIGDLPYREREVMRFVPQLDKTGDE